MERIEAPKHTPGGRINASTATESAHDTASAETVPQIRSAGQTPAIDTQSQVRRILEESTARSDSKMRIQARQGNEAPKDAEPTGEIPEDG